MTELERYISKNHDAFDSEPVPAGSRERFMAIVTAEKRKRRIRIMSLAISGMAAALAILLTVCVDPDISKELKRHHTRLAEKENEILAMVERDYPDETDMVINTLRSIISEAIPLEEQLPDELPVKEKSRILEDYYESKYSALESLMINISRNQ